MEIEEGSVREFEDAMGAAIARLDADVFLHSGALEPPHADILIRLASRPRRRNAYLFLATYGGLARTAYRMARCLRHAYEHFTVVVSGPCKSAGTLLVIGADRIAMAGGAELGPLDVQLLKDDELLAFQSGLIPDYSFAKLRREARDAFREFFMNLKFGGRMTTLTAADTAAKLTTGLFAPIFGQIDPLRIGEVKMAQLIAHKYAETLVSDAKRANIETSGITQLLSGYPSHDYVIDRTEAAGLFNRLDPLTEDERVVAGLFLPWLETPKEDPPVTLKLNDEAQDESREEVGDQGPGATSAEPSAVDEGRPCEDDEVRGSQQARDRSGDRGARGREIHPEAEGNDELGPQLAQPKKSRRSKSRPTNGAPNAGEEDARK